MHSPLSKILADARQSQHDDADLPGGAQTLLVLERTNTAHPGVYTLIPVDEWACCSDAFTRQWKLLGHIDPGGTFFPAVAPPTIPTAPATRLHWAINDAINDLEDIATEHPDAGASIHSVIGILDARRRLANP